MFQGRWPGEASLGLTPLKHRVELADIAQSLQNEQFADKSLRVTGRQRREDRRHTAELDQAAPGHHSGVSLFVDIFLRMAGSYHNSARAWRLVHGERGSIESARTKVTLRVVWIPEFSINFS